MKPQQKIGLGLGAAVLSAWLLLVGCSQKDGFYINTLKSDVYTQLYAIHAYDFLWVLDNSPSMDPKNQYLHDNIQTFLNTLNSRKAVDSQMAVTNVDFFSNPGGLIAGTGGLTVVKSATSANPAADFQSIVSNITHTGTAFWEQGLVQSYLAIQNSGSTFMRTGVPLVVIYMSDDDDWSCKQMLNGTTSCSGIQPENNPDVVLYPNSFFINYFKNLKAPENSTVTLFPITGTANADCTVERVGTRYQFVASQVGGDSVSGGLCPDQIGASLGNVAQTLADRGIRFPLSSSSNGQNITVLVNGQTVPYSSDNGYIYDATTNSIIFTGDAIPSNGDSIQILYQGQQ